MDELIFNDIFEEICIGLPPCNHNQTKICIKNFIEEKLKNKRYLLQLILTITKKINKKKKNLKSTKRLRKTLHETHRDLLIRWIVQLNKNNEDSYYDFRSLKLNSVSKNRSKNLANMDNCLFSEEAGNWIIKKLNNEKREGTIHYEHNPPVKVIKCIIEKLDTTSNIGHSAIASVIKEEKYCVMIITGKEHNRINTAKIDGKTSRDSGSFDDRIKIISNGPLYRIKPSSIRLLNQTGMKPSKSK